MTELQDAMTFAELPYTRPNLDDIHRNTAALRTAFENASSAEEQIALIRTWNGLRFDYGTNQSLAEVHYTQNVSDPLVKEEKNWFDENNPTVVEMELDVAKLILGSRFRDSIAAEFGELFLKRLDASVRTFSADIKELLVRESELCNEYNEITASAKIDVDGETYNLSSIGKLLTELDGGVRERAMKAMYAFVGSHKEAFDRIYHDLVTLRHRKAQLLGFTSYTEFRYVEFGRVDYTAKDVEAFRNAVVEHVVPLATKLRSAQSRRLGTTGLAFHDEKLQFTDGNPIANGDHDFIVDQARRMYEELSPETHEFFQLMLDRGLMDLKTRDNKATGGYCTSFSTFGLPFIFANFNRTTHDVEVLTHEAGHAFQAYRSRTYEVPEYRWPTAEACEIHSMGMEFLTWPWMSYFFGEQTDKFRFYHLQGAIIFLPYACAVDHFQHWVYDHPMATPAERNEAWRSMEARYMPWRDTSAVPEAAEGRQWQFQRHIYESPFYYIDYALAQTCALQYWQASEADRSAAFADYLRICDIGGSMPFLDIVAAGNLKSPFAGGTLKGIVDDAYAWLGKHYGGYLS